MLSQGVGDKPEIHSNLVFELGGLKEERASQVALVVKNSPANAEDVRDMGLIPGSGRSPGGGRGNPLQSSCLENPMDKGAWWAAVHSAAKSQTRMKQLSSCTKGKNKESAVNHHPVTFLYRCFGGQDAYSLWIFLWVSGDSWSRDLLAHLALKKQPEYVH